MSSTKDSKEQTSETKIKPNFNNLSSALKKNLQRRKKLRQKNLTIKYFKKAKYELALLQIGIVGVFCEGSEICYVLKG